MILMMKKNTLTNATTSATMRVILSTFTFVAAFILSFFVIASAGSVLIAL
jgi:hypothetical protein